MVTIIKNEFLSRIHFPRFDTDIAESKTIKMTKENAIRRHITKSIAFWIIMNVLIERIPYIKNFTILPICSMK